MKMKARKWCTRRRMVRGIHRHPQAVRIEGRPRNMAEAFMVALERFCGAQCVQVRLCIAAGKEYRKGALFHV